MNDSKINTRYAKAFFLLVKEKSIIEEAYQDMNLIFNTFNDIDDLINCIEDPVLKTSKKNSVISSVFKNKINEITLSFIQLILKNKRELFIKNIARHFIYLVKKDQGIKTVILTTTHKLDQKQKEIIVNTIKKEINSEIELTELIKSEIIGGFVLRIEDNLYDSSVKTELKKIREELINKS